MREETQTGASKALGPWIVVVSHVVPAVISAGNERRLARLLGHLKSSGCRTVLVLRALRLSPEERAILATLVDRVCLLPEAFSFAENMRWGLYRILRGIAWRAGLMQWVRPNPLEQFVRPSGSDDAGVAKAMKAWFCPPVLVKCTRSLCAELQPIAVIAEYIFTSPCLKDLPGNPIKIIDTIDVFSRIPETVHRHGISDLLACSEQEERNYLLNADVAMAIQPEEAAILKRLVPERVVISVGVDFDVVSTSDPLACDPRRVLIVGSDNPRNTQGLQQFLMHAWPGIRQAVPDASLRVCGGVSAHVPAEASGVCAVGQIPELGDEYAAAAVVVIPVIAGTGLKIKAAEALAHGKAVVATTHGVEGLVPRGEIPPCATAASWPGLTEEIVRLLTSDRDRQDAENRAMCYAKKRLSPTVVYRELDAVLLQQVDMRAGRDDPGL